MPPTTPPVPDGPWNESQNAPGYQSSTGSSQKSLFDTGNLDLSFPLTIDYGNRPSPGLRSRLPEADRQYADQHSAAPTLVGSPEDFENLLKTPVQLFTRDRGQFLQLQQMLFMAGYFGSASPDSVHFGSFTPATQQAWLHLLEATQMAQKSGKNITPEQFLEQAAISAKSAAGKAPAPPTIIHETDPKAVAGMLQQAAQSALGRNLSDQEVAHFISEYKAQEDAYYQKYSAAQAATTGTFTVSAPDLESQAKSFVQQEHGGEAQQQNDADYIGALEQMIGGL